MKTVLATLFLFFSFSDVFGQLEVSSGYAVNQAAANGAPLHIAYDFKIKNRLFTKSQFGYKYLYHYNDFVGATIKTVSWELHQTLSYEVVKKKKYIFKPNLGINYRFYHWKGEMKPPLNTIPIRAWVFGIKNDKTLLLESTSERFYDEHKLSTFGFSLQLQSQFRLNDKIWLHITPFMEPDYDRSQNTGGCYIGLILTQVHL